jgi:ferredoxin
MMQIISLTEYDVPAIDLANATSAGTGEDHDRDGRKDYTDKSDPIRELDCIWCMACVSVCPPQAINKSMRLRLMRIDLLLLLVMQA